MTSLPSYRAACLLHDVGKIKVGAENGTIRGNSTDKHVQHSAEFVRKYIGDEKAAVLIESHHSGVGELPEALQRDGYVLRAANSLASTHEREATTTSDRLESVFSHLSGFEAESAVYPLAPLRVDRQTMFPRPKAEHGESVSVGYQRLWDELTETAAGEQTYETLTNTLEKYAWCVPSIPHSPGLPLYDHLRTTAAIGEALHRSDLTSEDLRALAAGKAKNQPGFSLIKGDISGIQAFLSRMKNPDEAQDRVSKRMRGRSTQLWLLNEGLGRLFLRRLDLPITSMIWSGGGQFYALVPTSERPAVDEFEREVNQWLLERFDGDLFFVLGRADAQRANTDFSALFRLAASDTDAKKLQKGSSALVALETPVLGEANEPCAACGGQKDNHIDRCFECEIQEELGRHLPRATCLALDYSVREDAQFALDLPNGGLSWRLLDTPREADGVYRLNGTEMPETEGLATRGFVFTGSTVPHGGAVDRVWSFSEQAGLGRSEAELLYTSKMDIDSLGEAISTTMEQGLLGLAAVSRSLESFFAGYINEIAGGLSYVRLHESEPCEDCREALRGAETETRVVEHAHGAERDKTEPAEYHKLNSADHSALHDGCIDSVSPIYIGFAGGDDMFFVGPWDEAIAFGRAVRKEFEQYCSGALTLSGGFTLSRPKYPVGRTVESAEEELEMAKEFTYKDQSKDAVSLFGETLGWDIEDYPGMGELVDIGYRFEELIEHEELSKSALYSFLDLRNQTYPDQVSLEEVSIGVQHEWKLKYLLARNTEEPVMSELEATVPRALPWISVPVSWASLATR